MGGRSFRSNGGGLVRMLACFGFASSSSELEEEAVAREGHIRVVVVGNTHVEDEEKALFELEAHYLKHPLIEKLLKMTGEEYGYSYKGALRIACDVHLFRYLLQLLTTGNPAVHYLDLPLLISKFSSKAN